jgi:hypothetical protein
MSNKRKLRQRNGGKLTRDRQEWTHKKRLGYGSAILMPTAGRNRTSNRNELHSIAARTMSNGVQKIKGGQAINYGEFLLAAMAALPPGAGRAESASGTRSAPDRHVRQQNDNLSADQ